MKCKLLIMILLSASLVFSQNSNHSRYIGKVYDNKTGLGMDGVKVFTNDSSYSGISGKSGKFIIVSPKNQGPFIFNKESYKQYILDVKSHNKIHRVYMEKLVADTKDIVFPKNTVIFYPVKLILGSISASYHRSIAKEFVGGVNLRYYYNGKQMFGNEKFTGVKLAPMIRYFIKRNSSFGYYVEGKIIVGYFDFTRLNYNYSNNMTKNFPIDFWTGGISTSIGIMDILGNSKNIVLDLSFSVQIFPPNYPTEKTDEHGNTMSHNNLWWIAGGPGSLIEINLGIGGIF